MSSVAIFDDREVSPSRLTCIIPFRYLEERPDAIERFSHSRLDTNMPNSIHFLVVDDGSPTEKIQLIRNLCKKFGYSYLYLETSKKQFSVGRCRNFGAQYSRSKFIFMQDIDLMPYCGFYENILIEITVQGLEDNPNRFLMIPYIFLSETGTKDFLNFDPISRKQHFLHAALIADKTLIEKYSSGTSANVYDRISYLARGGNDKAFEGWGYEDIEFNTRAIRADRYFPIARDWALEKFNFNSVLEWKTYKATYRLHGDLCLYKGIVLFHAWHPVVQSSDYMKKQTDNRELFITKLKNFAKYGIHPPVLPSYVGEKWICFRENAFTTTREVRAALGQVLLRDEKSLNTASDLFELFSNEDATGILFFNPYQTEKMKQIYDWVRSLKINYLVAERGALPGSSFFDKNGFLADSKSYSKSAWNARLNPAQIEEADSILKKIENERPALESQSEIIGGFALRKSLGIPDENKVVFVALQRPGDTVTRFFLEDLTYKDYLEEIEVFSKIAPSNITLVIKKHPLEDHTLDVEHAVYANEANINDLIDASDIVWTFNSGVGLLAMLFNKPVVYSGKAFYSIKDVNWYCSSASQIIDMIYKRELKVDSIAARQFLRHVVTRVYSFGEHVTKPVRMADGSRMTATTEIKYEVLRLPGRTIKTPRIMKPTVTWDSFLFDRYRFAEKLHLDAQKRPAQGFVPHASMESTAFEIIEPLEIISAPVANESCDNDIRTTKRFQLYYNVYSRFLTPSKAEHLWNRPSSFLIKAKHPVSKFGRLLMSKFL